MYLKQSRHPYRRRRPRSSSFGRVFVLLLLIGAGLYLIRQMWTEPASVPTLNTPTPPPTPTQSVLSLVAEASDLYWAGQTDESLTMYLQALDLEPEQPELYVTLGQVLVFRGRPERGLQLAQEALLLDAENARAWAVKCLAYDWLGMPEEALPICEQAIALDPALPEGYAYLAEVYIDLGNWFAANDAIATALQLDENSADVLRGYSYVLEVQGNYSAAINAYRQALQQRAGLTHVYLAIGRNQQALGYFSSALETYQTAIENDPGSVAALDMLGWSYLLQGDYELAQQYLERALDINPTYSRALGHLGTLYFQRRNYEDAIPVLERAIRYGEADRRRQTVSFWITVEPLAALGAQPMGQEVLRGEFVHPADTTYPLRALLAGEGSYATTQGRARFDPVDDRYTLALQGLPAPPAGQAYVGWFAPLLLPERTPVHTAAMLPDAQGVVELSGATGAVKGPPIENYYTLALCYYFLDRCDEAQPYIETALRLDPEDGTALQTQQLCAE